MFYGYFIYDWLLGRTPDKQDDTETSSTECNAVNVEEENEAIRASINDPPAPPAPIVMDKPKKVNNKQNKKKKKKKCMMIYLRK